MGKPKKRVSPRIANQVDRDFERLILLSIVSAVRATNENATRSVVHAGRIVAVCVFMKTL